MNLDIIRYEHVTAGYGPIVAIEDITLEISCSSLVAVVGPNGAGKSSLLKATLGWLPLRRGRIMLGDDHIAHQRPRVAYVPQKQNIDWDFPITVRGVVEQGRYTVLRGLQSFRKEDHELVDSALEELGLADVADRPLGFLSGGQQQRVFLARALAQGGDVFLLDEPFEGLDAIATDHLIELFREWRNRHRTIMVVVHDLPMALAEFPRAVLLNRRLIAQGATRDVLTPENLKAAYGLVPSGVHGLPNGALSRA